MDLVNQVDEVFVVDQVDLLTPGVDRHAGDPLGVGL